MSFEQENMGSNDQTEQNITNIRPTLNAQEIFRRYGLIIAFFIMVLILSIISPTFLTPRNIVNVLRQVSINGIIALGMTFVILIAAIDLSVGSLVAVAGVIAGSIIVVNPNAVFYAILAGMGVCAVFGFLSGVMISKLNIPAFIASLAMLTIARGFALVYANGRPYILTSESFKALGQGYVGPIPIPVVILGIVAIVLSIILYLTRFGRHVFAVGGNVNAAVLSGVNTHKITIFVFTISGALAGLSGTILASRINSGQPSIGSGFELDAIASVVIGGTSLNGGSGKIYGTILGFLIIGIINNGLNLLNVSSYYQLIVKGLIIAGAVMLDQATNKK